MWERRIPMYAFPRTLPDGSSTGTEATSIAEFSVRASPLLRAAGEVTALRPSGGVKGAPIARTSGWPWTVPERSTTAMNASSGCRVVISFTRGARRSSGYSVSRARVLARARFLASTSVRDSISSRSTALVRRSVTAVTPSTTSVVRIAAAPATIQRMLRTGFFRAAAGVALGFGVAAISAPRS